MTFFLDKRMNNNKDKHLNTFIIPNSEIFNICVALKININV